MEFFGKLCGVTAVADVGINNVLVLGDERLLVAALLIKVWCGVFAEGFGDFVAGWSRFVIHGDTGTGVIVVEKIRIINDCNKSFGTFFGYAGIMSYDTGRRSVEWVFFVVLFFVGGDGIFTFFIGAHLFEDALVFDVTLVVFHFGVPIGVLCAIGTVFAVYPALNAIIEALNAVNDIENVT